MSVQTSLQDVVRPQRRESDLAGEELLRSETPAPAPSVPVQAEAPKPPVEQPAKQVETQGASTAPAEQKTADDELDENDPHPVPRKALISERKKRQDAERRLAELSGRLSAIEQRPAMAPAVQQQAQAPQEIDYFANPEKAIGLTVEQKLAAVQQKQAAEQFTAMRELVKTQFPDFEEIESEFKAAAASNPEIQARLRMTPPAQHPMLAYQVGKQLRRLGGATTVEELEAKITREVEERLRKQGALAAAEKASTTSAGARGSGATSAPVFAGPTPLSAVIGKRKG